jgi:hypothetical protein
LDLREVGRTAVAQRQPRLKADADQACGGRHTAPSTTNLERRRQLYRKYCGQCHALNAALAAGFGTNNGLGTNGGPSFNNLRVPFSLSVLAVKQPFIGHEVLIRKMTWTEITQVACGVR